MSVRKLRYNKTSGFRGVSWSSRTRKWQVCVSFGAGKLKNLGHFRDELDAVLVYDRFVRNNGMPEKANFPTYTTVERFRDSYQDNTRRRMISAQRFRLKSLYE